MNIDSRAAGMSMFNTLGVAELVWTLYARMFALHDLSPGCGVSDLKGQVKLPPMIRTSYDRLSNQGAYILDTGSDLFFWLGSKVSTQFLRDVFNVDTLDAVDPSMVSLKILSFAFYG